MSPTFNLVTQFMLTLPSQHVDLNHDDAIQVHISDALNEQDVVKFTIHTKVRSVSL